MRAECKEITWGAKELGGPRPDTIPTYYPSVKIALQTFPNLVETLKDLGGKHLSTAFGYGSSFSGESTDSMLDFILIVNNPALFHRENKQRRPHDYPPIFGDFRIQSWATRFSPNFLHSNLSVDGERRVKYAVLGFDNFLTQARAGLRGSAGPAHLYTAGRLQKVMILPFILVDDPEKRHQIDLAINQARIDGLWLALGLLPEIFDYSSLLRTYVGLSYAADIRVEKANKVDLLIAQSKYEYVQMMEDLFRAFVESDVLEEIGTRFYRKKITLEEREVRDWIRESALYSAAINYIKNPLICGFGSALAYTKQKVNRVRNQQSKDVVI